MRAALERRKCADCPASTTKVYCRHCVRRHAKPAGQGPLAKVRLFSGSPEADKRRRAVLDAIDLIPLIDRDGWVNFLTWCDRAGYEVPEKRQPGGTQRKRGEARVVTKDAAIRQWERLKARLRAQGIEVEPRAAEDYGSNVNGADPEKTFAHTSMRFTVDGWDRLRALTKALDDWLCAVQEVA